MPEKVYRTPWGIRVMNDAEVADLRAQGVSLTEVDDVAADVSLESEKDELSKVTLTDTRVPKPRG